MVLASRMMFVLTCGFALSCKQGVPTAGCVKADFNSGLSTALNAEVSQSSGGILQFQIYDKFFEETSGDQQPSSVQRSVQRVQRFETKNVSCNVITHYDRSEGRTGSLLMAASRHCFKSYFTGTQDFPKDSFVYTHAAGDEFINIPLRRPELLEARAEAFEELAQDFPEVAEGKRKGYSDGGVYLSISRSFGLDGFDDIGCSYASYLNEEKGKEACFSVEDMVVLRAKLKDRPSAELANSMQNRDLYDQFDDLEDIQNALMVATYIGELGARLDPVVRDQPMTVVDLRLEPVSRPPTNPSKNITLYTKFAYKGAVRGNRDVTELFDDFEISEKYLDQVTRAYGKARRDYQSKAALLFDFDRDDSLKLTVVGKDRNLQSSSRGVLLRYDISINVSKNRSYDARTQTSLKVSRDPEDLYILLDIKQDLLKVPEGDSGSVLRFGGKIVGVLSTYDGEPVRRANFRVLPTVEAVSGDESSDIARNSGGFEDDTQSIADESSSDDTDTLVIRAFREQDASLAVSSQSDCT